jgi:predicted patatin/cPLA2 family phospholipase
MDAFNLVISTGGIAIICLAGVLDYLDKKKLLFNIKNYYGTSAGAILSLMLALKYTIYDIKNIIMTNNHTILDDIDISNLFTNYGLTSTKKLIIIIQSIIFFKKKNKNYTFKNLYDDHKINLNIYATCIKTKKLVTFNNILTPNLPLWKAVIASSCIPILFFPFKIDSKKYVDGGLLNSYPINFIPIDEYKNTIGIYYNGSINIKCSEPFIKYFMDIILCKYNSDNINYLPFQSFTINVPHINLSIANDLILTKKQKIDLYNHGITNAEQQIYKFQPKKTSKRSLSI